MESAKPYPECGFAYVDGVMGVNHKPHPYMIGHTHLTRNNSMYLGDTQIREMERKHGPMCYWKGKEGNHGPRCTLRYDEHTCDMAAFVKLTRDCSNKEMATWLYEVCKPWAEEHGIDGFAFVDTGFRVAEPIEEENPTG